MNILIIGGSGEAPGANSVCVRNMAKQFVSLGHKVWILALGDKYSKESGNLEGAIIWQIPDSYYGKLTHRVSGHPTFISSIWFKIVSIIRHLILLPLYPETSPLRTLKVTKKAKSLVKENDITEIITIYNNSANILTGIRLKRHFREKIHVVSYHLDLRTGSINSSSMVRNYIRRHALESIVDENRIVDKMLIPYSGMEEIKTVEGIDLHKVHFVGFPVFIEDDNTEKCTLPFDSDAINISYVGTLSKDNRDPSYVISLLEDYTKKVGKKICLHIWGKADGFEILIEKSPVAQYHGMIENKYVRHIMNSSDFLLNIGNAIAYNMLPSKVFSLFATGKPIINIITHPLDATLPYFERYNNSIDIKEYDKSFDNEIVLFGGLNNAKKMPVKSIESKFDDFKPETICDLIIKKG